jgi:hypothetical protein
MIGIADQKLWNLGVGLLSKWNGLFIYFIVNDLSITHSMPVPHERIFLFYAPVTLPQPGWGRIVEQVQVLVA